MEIVTKLIQAKVVNDYEIIKEKDRLIKKLE